MSTTTAAPAAPVAFEVSNYEIVGKGAILGRFDLTIKGVITLFKCGLFRKGDGTLFVNAPSVNISRWDPKAAHPHIKTGSIDREMNPVLTAAAEQAHAAKLAELNAQAAGVSA